MKGKKEKNTPFHLTLVLTLIAVTAAVLLSYFYVSVQRVTGNTMDPTLKSGDIIIVLKDAEIQKGDVAAFYYDNKILVRRVIGSGGDLIDIDESGTVSVNGTELEETYISQKVSGNGDTQFPYQVSAERYFVLGDNRDIALDSRSTQIGCVSESQILGKAFFRIWPLNRIAILTEAQES